MATTTGVDGRFTLPVLPPGTVDLSVRLLGYTARTITGIEVAAGSTVEQVIQLHAEVIQLEGIEVTTVMNRGSINSALEQQRAAHGVVSTMTAEQISRSPDGDVARALQRLSGVTVQDGKYISVRGLGGRYTTASLNGAPIPSPEPERKVVPLDLFPVGLVQTITTAKTFTPDRPGDFSGAQVDIRTSEFPVGKEIAYSLSLGYTPGVTGAAIPTAPGEGLEWLGFGGKARSLPSSIARAGDFEPPPAQSEINHMTNSFRNAWSVQERQGAPNASLGASWGGSSDAFGQRIGYLLSGTYSLSHEANMDERRAVAIADGSGGTAEVDRFEGATGRTSVLWGGLLNLNLLLGGTGRIAINSTYNRTADNEARREDGFSENLGGQRLRIDRLRYVERSISSHQAIGEHQINGQHQLAWTLDASAVRRHEPDRSEIVYASAESPATGQPLPPAWFSLSNEGAVRTFADLRERSIGGALNYRLRPRGDEGLEFRFGALARSTARETDNQAYSIAALLDQASRELTPEEIFDGRFAADAASHFRITPLRAGGAYTASDQLYAGYGMAELPLGRRVRVIGGARVERSETVVTAEPTIGRAVRSEPVYTDLLPSLALNLSLSESQSLRLSAARTLARPEYRELAEIQYREVIGGENVIGNPALRRTLIQNFDARWEWYPSPGELFSVAFFVKNFQDPIERIYLATSGTRVVTFVNAESASNYGTELELRKGLGSFAERLAPLTLFANATLMHSTISVGNGALGGKTADRAMVGQAPYVLNAGLTYAAEDERASATILFNIVGRRIVSASEAPLPDFYEQPRGILDLALRLPLASGISAKLDAKNILNSPHRVTQGTVVTEYFRTGPSYSLGIQWRP
jgi:outer membrane receptor protein involved in Fe transport